MSIETETLNQTKNEMEKAIAFYETELSSIRTGRADPKLLQNIKVDYYGTLTPLTQLCTISTPEPMSLFIQPWDKQSIKEIERAIDFTNMFTENEIKTAKHNDSPADQSPFIGHLSK